MRYRTKPIEVEAVQWQLGVKIAGVLEVEEVGKHRPQRVARVHTPSGPLYARAGDFIVTGADGEKRVVCARLFDKLYERVEQEATT